MNVNATSQLDTCMKTIVLLQKWQPMTSEVIACMAKEEDFAKAVSYLCPEKRSAISVELQKYLAAKDVYMAAWEKYRTATDPATRNYAAVEMQNAEQDWSLGGYRQEVDSALNVLSSNRFKCLNL